MGTRALLPKVSRLLMIHSVHADSRLTDLSQVGELIPTGRSRQAPLTGYMSSDSIM